MILIFLFMTSKSILFHTKVDDRKCKPKEANVNVRDAIDISIYSLRFIVLLSSCAVIPLD